MHKCLNPKCPRICEDWEQLCFSCWKKLQEPRTLIIEAKNGGVWKREQAKIIKEISRLVALTNNEELIIQIDLLLSRLLRNI